jgi:hypothetical protein
MINSKKMESKILIFATLLGAGGLVFTMIPEDKYKKKPKDKITIESEKYLEDLKHENEALVDSIKKSKLVKRKRK